MREAHLREPMPLSLRRRCSYQSEWRSPWKRDAVRKNVMATRWPVWVRQLRSRAGIYFIRDAATKKMLYIGRGQKCLKDALVRHFYHWGIDVRGAHRRVVLDRRLVEVKVWYVRQRVWVPATEADAIAMYAPSENRRQEASNRSYRNGDGVPF